MDLVCAKVKQNCMGFPCLYLPCMGFLFSHHQYSGGHGICIEFPGRGGDVKERIPVLEQGIQGEFKNRGD